MYRAVIFYGSGLTPMKHSVAEEPTPEAAFAKAGAEFYISARMLTWQPSSGIVFYNGHIPCGCVVFKVA